MKTSHPCASFLRARVLTLAATLPFAFSPQLALAQAAPVRPASTPTSTPATTSSDSTATKSAEEVVALSPFAVVASGTDSYSALNTNSVTRFSAELSKLPVSADVFTESFLDDIAATSLEEMVVNYGTGTGVGGANPEGTAESNRPGDRASNVNVKIRGLDAGQMRINSFGAGGIDDAFSTERVDVVRGPQSLLNGGVGGGGVVNAISKQARFNSRLTRLQFRTDDNGSLRGVVDYGLGGQRLALRLSGMMEDQRTSRLFFGAKSRGVHAQVAVQATKTTTVRVETSRKLSETVQSNNGTTLSMPAATVNGVRLNADPRNGARLRLLVAQGQAGDIMGGRLHWDNVDSLRTAYYGAKRENTHYETSLEQKVGRFGTVQLATMYDVSGMDRGEPNAYTNLVAPLRNNNPFNEWAIGFQPGNTHESFTRRGYRANFAGEFALFGGLARNQVLLGATYETVYNKRRSQFYYLADASGKAVVNPAQINNTNIGRTPMPVQWFAFANGPLEYLSFGRRDQTIKGQDGLTYVYGERVETGALPQTRTNPLGVRGTGSFWDQRGYTDSYYAAAQTDWFGDRFTTLAGYRTNNVENKRYEIGDAKRSQKSPGSLNLGANYRLNRFLRPYYGYSNAFNPPDIVQFGPHGEVAQTAHSIGHEFGLKFDPKSGFFSGSVGVFTVKSKDEQVSIATDLRDDINPPGINGAYSPTQNWINVDRESKGAELILTAQPVRNWRARFSLAFTDGKVGESKKYAIFYNDEFNTDGRGGVTYGDGTPLLVTVDPAQQANPAAPRQQLTVAMMNNPASPYFAVLDPDSGRITNATALRLTTTSATGAPVGTGRRGLPLSAHQLRFTDPNGNGGSIVVSQEGEPTSGYAKYSANFTNSYSFTEGRLKGLTLGGTIFLRMQDRTYPYTQVFRDAAGVVTRSERRMFSAPDYVRANAMLAYRFKFARRYEWSTQVNIENLFNQYQVQILPNGSTGDARTARFTAEPRGFVWTNSVSF